LLLIKYVVVIVFYGGRYWSISYLFWNNHLYGVIEKVVAFYCIRVIVIQYCTADRKYPVIYKIVSHNKIVFYY